MANPSRFSYFGILSFIQNIMQKMNIKLILLFFCSLFFLSASAQTKVAKVKDSGKGYDIVIDQKLLIKVFVNLFSTEEIRVKPENMMIMEGNGTRDLMGAIYLTAESRMGEEGYGSKVMRIYLLRGHDGFLYIPDQIIGEECMNLDCTRCAFDDDSGCFCSLRTEENSHVVGCRHLIIAGQNQRK